jgi:spermidine/putrescine transport system ATP-binding protein
VANLFSATAGARDGGGRCRLRVGEFELEAAGGDTAATGEVRVVIRPERVQLEEYGSTGPNRVPGMVERLVYQGPATQLVIRLANGESLQALVQNQGQPLSWRQGTAIAVHLPADALRVLAESSPRVRSRPGLWTAGRTPPASRLPSHQGPCDRGPCPEWVGGSSQMRV